MKAMFSSNKVATTLAVALAFTASHVIAAPFPVPFPKINTNLPTISVIASDPVALEGTSTASFTLLRYGPTNSPVAVTLGISGTASNGVDYGPITNTITLPAGDLALDIPIVPLMDTNHRGNKTVVLTVETNADYNVVYRKRASVKIIDDIYNIPPPTVLITSPTNGVTYTNPAIITITAAASDEDVPVTSVSFFANDDFLGKRTNSPFTLTWTNTHAGKYTLFATAVDSVDQTAVSAPVSITVSNVPVVTTSSKPKH
jgi:hypothetical protein